MHAKFIFSELTEIYFSFKGREARHKLRKYIVSRLDQRCKAIGELGCNKIPYNCYSAGSTHIIVSCHPLLLIDTTRKYILTSNNSKTNKYLSTLCRSTLNTWTPSSLFWLGGAMIWSSCSSGSMSSTIYCASSYSVTVPSLLTSL